MVRPSPPRFLNFGDRFELPVVVQNQTDAPLSVDVAVRATNATLTAGAGRRRDRRRRTTASRCASRRRPRRPARRASRSAPPRAGVADAAELELPVWTPATTEAFATYGADRRGRDRAAGARRPSAVVPQFGGLESRPRRPPSSAHRRGALPRRATRSSAPSSSPRACSAIAALRDVLAAFKAEGLPAPEALEAVGEARPRAPGARCRTTTAASVLAARRRVLAVPRRSTSRTRSPAPRPRASRCRSRCSTRSRGYLREHRAPHPRPTTRSRCGARSSPTRSTSARCWATPTSARARTLVREAGVDSALRSRRSAGCSPTLVEATRRPRPRSRRSAAALANRVDETAGAAHFAVSLRRRRLPAAALGPPRRRDPARGADRRPAEQRPDPQARRRACSPTARPGAGRTRRRTRSCCSRSTATSRPTRRSTPDFVARVWLGERYAGEHAVQGPHDRAPAHRRSR